MNHHFKSLLSVGALALGSMSVHATPLSDAEVLANWQPEADFITNYNTANWVSSPYGVHSGGNVFGALVSDFVTTGDFQFTAQLTASGDNDYMGLVFGWQDMDNTYALGWGGGGVGVYNGITLYQESLGVKTLLDDYDVFWRSGASYDFSVGLSGSTLFYSVVDAGSLVYQGQLSGVAPINGRVGFSVASQSAYFVFDQASYLTGASAVPVPAVFLLLLTGAGMGWLAGRWKRQ